MIISVVDLWNLAHRSLLCSMTFTPFLATDSPVLLYVVTVHPVSGTVLTDTTSAAGRTEKEGERERVKRESEERE